MAPGASPLSAIPAPQATDRAAAAAQPASDAGFLAFLAGEQDAAPRQPPSAPPGAASGPGTEPAANAAQMGSPPFWVGPVPIAPSNIAAEGAPAPGFIASPAPQSTTAQTAPVDARLDALGGADPLPAGAQTTAHTAPSPVFADPAPTPIAVAARVVDQPVGKGEADPATTRPLPPRPDASLAAVPQAPASAAPPPLQSSAPLRATRPTSGADPSSIAPLDPAKDAPPLAQLAAADNAAGPGQPQTTPPIANTIDMRAGLALAGINGPTPETPSVPRQPVPTTTPATTITPDPDLSGFVPSVRVRAAEQPAATTAAPAPAQANTAAPPPAPPATDGGRWPAARAPDGNRPDGMSPAVTRVIEAMQASPEIGTSKTPDPRATSIPSYPNTTYAVPPAPTPSGPLVVPQPTSPPRGTSAPSSASSAASPPPSPAPRTTSAPAPPGEPRPPVGMVAKSEAGPPAAAPMRPGPPLSGQPPEPIAAPQLRQEQAPEPPAAITAWEPDPGATLQRTPSANSDRSDIASPITGLDRFQEAALPPVAAGDEGRVQNIDELPAISAAPLREAAGAAPVSGSPAAPALARAQQIAAQITAQTANLTSIADRAAPLEIALDPPELGQLRISVARGEDGLVLNVAVDRPETLELMRRHAGALNQEFQRLGLGNTGFSFSGRDDGPAMPAQATSEGAAIATAETAPDAGPPANARQSDGTSLDIRI